MSANRILRAKVLFNAAKDALSSAHMFAAGLAVSLLQDSVEAMAHEVAATVDADTKPQMRFNDYWDAVGKKGRSLPYRTEMQDLNTARVGFKHRGVNPDRADIEKFITSAHLFLVETARDFLRVSFDEVSEADVVVDERTRTALKAAESAIGAGQADDALKRCRDALDLVEQNLRKTILVNKSRIDPYLSTSEPIAAEVMVWTAEQFDLLERSVVLSILRVNPSEFWLLSLVLPVKEAEGGYKYKAQRPGGPDATPTIELATVCVEINYASCIAD